MNQEKLDQIIKDYNAKNVKELSDMITFEVKAMRNSSQLEMLYADLEYVEAEYVVDPITENANHYDTYRVDVYFDDYEQDEEE